MKKYAEQREAKKNYRNIKGGPQKLNFGASKPVVRGGGAGPLGSPLDPLVLPDRPVVDLKGMLLALAPKIHAF